MSMRLIAAKDEFVKKHRNPKVIKLDNDTEVINMQETENRKPEGDFEDSWTQYWLAFTEQSFLCCSECGKPLWNKECEKSEAFCKDVVRKRQINSKVENTDNKETLADYKSQGGHVKLDDTIYIAPLCYQHNNNNVGEKIVLKSGTILVEEIEPRIE